MSGEVEVHGITSLARTESALEGKVITPAPARIGLFGPLHGQVVRINSSHLDFRKPTVTVMQDFDTGIITSAKADATPLMTYVPEEVRILQFRTYRVWIDRMMMASLSPEEIEQELFCVLVDNAISLDDKWDCLVRE